MFYIPPQYMGLLGDTMGDYQMLPNGMHKGSQAYFYWFRSLAQRLQSRLGINGFPEEWNGLGVKDFFKFVLFYRGFVAGTTTTQWGKIFGMATLSGHNWCYQPTTANILLPMLKNTGLNRTIGKDCAVLKLTPDYVGLYDCIDYFATKLANLDCGIDGAIENSKLAQIVGGSTKGAMNALSAIMQDVANGKTRIVYSTKQLDKGKDGEAPFSQVKLFTKEDYVLDKMLVDLQTIINQFDAEIGIATVPYQKAERMVSDEANSKQEDSRSRFSLCIECLNDSVKEWNKIMEQNLSFEMNTLVPSEGDDDNVNVENDTQSNGRLS